MKSRRLVRPLLDTMIPLQVENGVLVTFAIAEILDFRVKHIPDKDQPVMACTRQEVATVTELCAEDVSLVSLKLKIR